MAWTKHICEESERKSTQPLEAGEREEKGFPRAQCLCKEANGNPISQKKEPLEREGGRDGGKEGGERKVWIQPCKLQHPSLDSPQTKKHLRLLPKLWAAF